MLRVVDVTAQVVFEGKAAWQEHESFRQSYCDTQSSTCVVQEVETFSGNLVGSEKGEQFRFRSTANRTVLYLGASGDQL